MQLILLISCPDQPGIVARFTGVLYDVGGNILSLEQHVESDGWFFMRIHVDLGNARVQQEALLQQLEELAATLKAKISHHDPASPIRVAVLGTSEAACPQELLSRQQAGQLACEIPLMVANRDDLKDLAKMYHVPFEHVEFDSQTQAEARVLELLDEHKIELVVLARFMKVLSPEFVDKFPERIINIHHGFLPAFKGARPYHQAWERGVKVIGATAHFATAELDAGPIIAQDVMPVSHHHSAEDMVRAGQDIERRVLLQAVQAYLERKIILHNQRTIVFH